MRDSNWDLYTSICVPDVRLSCNEHENESTDVFQTLSHTQEWRATFHRIEFSFPYASIGSQFAVVNYSFNLWIQPGDQKEPDKTGTNWMLFRFDQNKSINRILHALPDEISDSMRRLQSETL